MESVKTNAPTDARYERKTAKNAQYIQSEGRESRSDRYKRDVHDGGRTRSGDRVRSSQRADGHRRRSNVGGATS